MIFHGPKDYSPTIRWESSQIKGEKQIVRGSFDVNGKSYPILIEADAQDDIEKIEMKVEDILRSYIGHEQDIEGRTVSLLSESKIVISSDANATNKIFFRVLPNSIVGKIQHKNLELSKAEQKEIRKIIKNLKQIPGLEKKIQVGASKDLVAFVLLAEKELTQLINDWLARLDPKMPLENQKHILKKVNSHIAFLKKINIRMTRLSLSFYLENASDHVKSIADTFQCKLFENTPILMESERKLIEGAEVFLIVSLMKIDQSPLGAEFLQELKDSLTQKKHTIELRAPKKIEPSSLLAFQNGPPADASITINQEKMEAIGKRLVELSEELNSMNSDRFNPGDGTSSVFGFPIWPEIEVDDHNIESIMENLHASKDSEEAIGDLISGNFSFAQGSQMFYTPAHIEVAHEFLHVMHNSQGISAPAVRISEDDRLIWHDFEEYMAIEGGKFSENSLGKEFGLPNRYGHSGMAFHSLNKEDKKYMSQTPEEISGAEHVH